MEIFTKNTIGVAGCGSMGLPMAKTLAASTVDVCGFDIRPFNEFSDFALNMVASPQQFADKCEIVICVVRDEKQVLDLCFDNQAIFASGNHPTTFVLSSTVSPRFVKFLDEKLPADVVLIDAPMSGAPLAATSATLTFMIGGPEKDVTRLMPIFQAMGNQIYHLGKLGSGMTTKVLNNFVAASTVVAVRNVLHQAGKLDMNQQKLLDVMSQSSGQTWFGSNFDKIDWAKEAFAPENTIGILEKDVRAFIDVLEDESKPLHNAIIAALQTLPPASA